MSHNTEIHITSGTDVLSFDTGNRDLAESLFIPKGKERTYHGGDAVAFLNGNTNWFNNVPENYRKIVMLLTDYQRLSYSDRLNHILSTHDDRPVAERYEELNSETSLSITISHRY